MDIYRSDIFEFTYLPTLFRIYSIFSKQLYEKGRQPVEQSFFLV